jgi:amidohydrolase
VEVGDLEQVFHAIDTGERHTEAPLTGCPGQFERSAEADLLLQSGGTEPSVGVGQSEDHVVVVDDRRLSGAGRRGIERRLGHGNATIVPGYCCPVPPSTPASELIDRALDGVADRMVAFRRDIHAHPEVAWHEHRTSTAVVGQLRESGLSPGRVGPETGVVCEVTGDGRGPLVAIRADLDALPIVDEKDVGYRSCTPGVAHACGHDAHTAVVVGAGIGLARLAAGGELPGRVRLLFQPAEEVLPGGALPMLAAGALDDVSRVYALHCDPRVDAGTVAVRDGAVTGATDALTVTVSGPGGHTSRPHLTVDVVAALADVVARSPAVLSRRVDPRAGLSLVWGRIAAGSASNVIPHTGEASGSVRTLDAAAWRGAEKLVPEIIREIAAPYHASVEIDYVRGVPPAVNDTRATAAFRKAAAEVLGTDAVREAEQSMGAEDFAWMLDRTPGVLARLGVRRPGTAEAPDIHRGDFDIDEAAIGCGIRVLMAVALDSLRRLSQDES